MKYIIVLDAGTTSVRAFVYDLQSQRFIHCAQQPVGLSLPRSGWVEQDADEIYYKSAYVINDCMRVAGAENVARVGIANQREAVVMWNRETGEPVCPVIGWQCRRTSAWCAALDSQTKELVRARTGLVPDAYFSASKIVWNFAEGTVIGTDETGHPVREGDANVVALSPFEIYPDNIAAEGMDEVTSLIHAKAVPVSEIAEKFGVQLAGGRIDEFAFLPYSAAGGWKRPADGGARPAMENAVVLIERYTRPSGAYPRGRLEIVAADRLLYEGELPYENGDRGERTLPFVRQTCIPLAGAFFGTSVVDRMIPLQRAYNAVRNRKHEFLNRLTMGVVAVEDGSVDAEELAEEGLYPGKVLVYRQGAAKPEFLPCGTLPAEFEKEEERIENEFVLVSGMSEVSRNSANPTNVTSAVGLQLLIDQDTNRMQMSAESVERAVRETGKQILHLYRQFAGEKRILRMTGVGGEAELVSFGASDISADDVEFVPAYERTAAERREEIFNLLSLGLLQDEEGKLSDETRARVLDALGYGSFENARDVSHLHLKKAERENVRLAHTDVEAAVYDDHRLHIAEHVRALLSGGEEDGEVRERIARHIASHREFEMRNPSSEKSRKEKEA